MNSIVSYKWKYSVFAGHSSVLMVMENCVEISENCFKLSAVKEKKPHEYPLYTIETFQSRLVPLNLAVVANLIIS